VEGQGPRQAAFRGQPQVEDSPWRATAFSRTGDDSRNGGNRDRVPGTKTAKGNPEQHLAVRRGGRVLLGAAKGDNGGNREPAIGSDEPYPKSPSWPGTRRSCRLFLRPVVTRCAWLCY
jgi:hypothetical protein